MPSLVQPERPKLAFFRWLRADQPGFLLRQLAEQVSCLEQFFDVELIDYSCDYDEVCDRLQPDLALFESGIYAGPRSISNTHLHPHVPKLGFLNADAFDVVRATFVSDMDRWGVDTFFTMSVSMAEYTPELADRLYVWPNFVDSRVHRDYGLPKTVPVLLTGSQSLHYPWRNAVSRIAAQNFPTMSLPHFGWGTDKRTQRLSVGEDYARLLNAALIAPTCGTVSRDVVRKHFEIPASRTCLVTERSASIESAGFLDMVNCVFAEKDDIVERLDHLLGNRQELQQITDAGHVLVNERHNPAQRRQIRDWFDLHRAGCSPLDIVQANPFAPLTRRVSPEDGRTPIVVSQGHDRTLIIDAWAALARGDDGHAARLFALAGNFYYMAEAVVGTAWLQLRAGDARSAGASIDRLLDRGFASTGAHRPDPVQWALRVRALLCAGELAKALEYAVRYPELQHPELSRTRWAVAHLNGLTPVLTPAGPPVATINPIPQPGWGEWVSLLVDSLRASGQPELVAGLTAAPDGVDPIGMHVRIGTVASLALRGRWNAPAVVEARVRAGRGWARRRLNTMARRLAGADWMQLVFEVAEREELQAAFIAAPSRLSLRERSVRNALARNPQLPAVISIGDASPPILTDLRGRAGRLASVDVMDLPVRDDAATLVYVGRAAARTQALAAQLTHARIVVVDDVAANGTPDLIDALLGGGGFEVVAHHVDRRFGYLILRRLLAQVPRKDTEHHADRFGN